MSWLAESGSGGHSGLFRNALARPVLEGQQAPPFTLPRLPPLERGDGVAPLYAGGGSSSGSMTERVVGPYGQRTSFELGGAGLMPAPPAAAPPRDPLLYHQSGAMTDRGHGGASTGVFDVAADSPWTESLEKVGGVISQALANLKDRMKDDTNGIRDVQSRIEKRIVLLRKKLKEANAERDAETEHSRRLSEAFSREMEKSEQLRQQLGESEARRSELEGQLAELQTQYFRSAGLASTISQVPNEHVEVLKAENEALHEELRKIRESTEKEEMIQKLEQDLDMQRPLMEQLRRDLLESSLRNKELQRQKEQLLLENEELRKSRRPPSSRLSNQQSGVRSVVAESETSNLVSEFDLEEHVRVNIDFVGSAAKTVAGEKTTVPGDDVGA